MLKIVSNVDTSASCVTTVMSSSPAWRRLHDLDDVAARGGTASRSLASTRMRNTAEVLKSCCALATGMITVSSTLKPPASPCSASTPSTRQRASPMRSHSPSGERARRTARARRWSRARRRAAPCRDRLAAGSGRLPMTQCWIVEHRGARAEHRDVALARARRHGAGAEHERRDAANARAARERERVVERQLARRLADEQALDAAAGRFGAARQHDQQLRAERRELARHVAARAFADGRQQDDGGDADRDREQHHRRAQRIAPQRLQRHPRDVDALSRASRLARRRRRSCRRAASDDGCARPPITGSCVTIRSAMPSRFSCSRICMISPPECGRGCRSARRRAG